MLVSSLAAVGQPFNARFLQRLPNISVAMSGASQDQRADDHGDDNRKARTPARGAARRISISRALGLRHEHRISGGWMIGRGS